MAKFKANIKDIDKGYKRIVQEFGKINGKVIKVGVQGGETNADGDDLVSIAVKNELGTDIIPSRPFLRQTYEVYGEQVLDLIAKQINFVYDNKKTTNQAMSEVGIWYEGRVKYIITNGDFEPNAPLTIALKKSSKPLIDTGRLRQSIRYVVEG